MGPAITAGSSQELFVVRNDMAVKVRVEKGLNNPDYVKILDPLQPGDFYLAYYELRALTGFEPISQNPIQY